MLVCVCNWAVHAACCPCFRGWCTLVGGGGGGRGMFEFQVIRSTLERSLLLQLPLLEGALICFRHLRVGLLLLQLAKASICFNHLERSQANQQRLPGNLNHNLARQRNR